MWVTYIVLENINAIELDNDTNVISMETTEKVLSICIKFTVLNVQPVVSCIRSRVTAQNTLTEICFYH